jgi:adenylate cyclase
VIGALYGERRNARTEGEVTVASRHVRTFTELEAKLVELLARGVAAGLSRLAEERKALRHRVQFEQFFTPELARQLASKPDMLKGQDREVTVLFCDIRGFSQISAELGAARTIQWCRDVLDMLSEAVLLEGGVVVDYVGDGLMAMWGAPNDQPDHAARACRAALAILEGLPALNQRWRKTLKKPMNLGIGINTGIAQVGNVGSRRKFKYGALGTTVNLASRVEGATKSFRCQVLLTASTRAALDIGLPVTSPGKSGGGLPPPPPPILTRRLGQVRLVGIERAVELHELFPNDCPHAQDARIEYEKALSLFEQQKFVEAARTLGNWRGRQPNDDTVLILLLRTVKAMVDGEVPLDHPVWELTEK